MHKETLIVYPRCLCPRKSQTKNALRVEKLDEPGSFNSSIERPWMNAAETLSIKSFHLHSTFSVFFILSGSHFVLHALNNFLL